MKEKFIIVVATGFGSGYAPFAPGTMGTVLGIPLAGMLSSCPWPISLISLLVFTLLSVYLAEVAEKLFEKKDPPCIVIDEIAGYLWTMIAVPFSLKSIIAGFICFRFFDIVKPFPIRRLQDRLPGGYGVVGDDVMAGIYSNLVLQGLRAFL